MMRYARLIYGLVTLVPLTAMAQTLPPPDAGNTPAEATNFKLGGKGSLDSLSSSQDVDFYKFSIKTDPKDPTHDTSGNLSVTFSQKAPPGANPQSGWRIDLYAQEDLANSLFTTTLPETSLKATFEQGLSPGTYYFKITALDSTLFPAATYTLLGIWKEDEHYEKQPNNAPEHATVIKVNESYQGNLSSAEDIDFYRFSLQVPDLVTISLTQTIPGADPTVGWQLNLIGQTQQTLEVPSTTLGKSLPVNLLAGTHYFSVGPRLQEIPESEGNNLVEKKAPVGRNYQIQVQAASVPPPTVACPFGYLYAQNPQTLHWGTFPTPCDIPMGWVSSPAAPTDYEVCPSPHATYKTSLAEGVGILQIPLVDYTDEGGNAYVVRAEMQAVPFQFPPLQFQVLMDSLRVIRFTPAPIQEVEPPPPVEQPPVTQPTTE